MDREKGLREEDVPGASLNGRQPCQLTISELQFWLKCRGMKASKLKTKAEYVAKVEMLKDCDLPIMDPTENGEYISRKRKLEDNGCTNSQDIPSDEIILPREGWGRILDCLPEFNDINIHAYSLQSGKNVQRDQSTLPNPVAQKTCIKPEKRGYQFFSEKYIHDLWITEKNNLVFLKARCFASQRKNDNPHHLWCALTKSYPSFPKKAYCSCVAGASGFCNHTFALLYQIAHFHKAGVKEVPQDVSKTSVPQQWNKPRVWGISPEPVMEMVLEKPGEDVRKRKPIQCSLYEARVGNLIENDPSLISSVKQNLKLENPLIGMCYMATPDDDKTQYIKTKLGTYTPLGSVLSYQQSVTEGDCTALCNWEVITKMDCSQSCNNLEIFPDLPLDCSRANITFDPSLPDSYISLLSSLQLSKEDAVTLEQQTRTQSQCDLWVKERKHRLTASNFGRIITRKSEKSNLVKSLLNHKEISAPSLMHGRKYEDVAVLKYNKFMSDSGHPVETFPSGLIVNPSHPYLGSSPDRKVLDKISHPHFGLLEIKCPYTCRNITPYEAASTDNKFCLEIVNGNLQLKKTHYYYQVQGQMALSGLKWCDFVVYTFKGINIERINFDEECWSSTHKKLELFYFQEFLPQIVN